MFQLKNMLLLLFLSSIIILFLLGMKKKEYFAIQTLNEKTEQAEKELQDCQNSVTWVSEANQLARLYWWTAEYGLVGKANNFQIYGGEIEKSEKIFIIF